MIDRKARTQFTEALRHLVSGITTNDQFEDSPSQKSKDPSIDEIFYLAAYPLYDDLKEHKLKGEYVLTEGQKLDLARCILFLKSDYEYMWPREVGRGLFTSRSTIRREWGKSDGDRSVWPFFHKIDYDEAKMQHPYMKPNHPIDPIVKTPVD
jgi:hypothetical protein